MKEAGYVYCPYVPLICSDTIDGPQYIIEIDEYGHEYRRYLNMTEEFLVPHVGEFGNVPREAIRKGTEEYKGKKILWEENKPFKASLSFETIYSNKGGMDVFAILEDASKKFSYYMQKRDFVKLVKTLPCVAGYFVGEWKFRREGRYISIVSV